MKFILFIGIVTVFYTNARADLATCFDCICRGKNDCGITWSFWSDAGKPCPNNVDPNTDTAYASCMSDPYCPRQCMEQYYIKFQQDCNGDGAINCYDYARLHMLGAYGCSGTPNKELQKIEHCLG